MSLAKWQNRFCHRRRNQPELIYLKKYQIESVCILIAIVIDVILRPSVGKC